jgi:integrase
MGKRANGEGSIYRRGDGWAAALSYVDADGRSRRHTVYGKTQADVRAKLKAAKDRSAAGAPPKDAKVAVGDFAARWITTTLAASSRKESTKQTYGILTRKWIVGDAVLAGTTLDRLRPSDVDSWVSRLKAAELSESTIRQTYTVLRAILDGAVRDDLVARNAAAAVGRPRVSRTEARSLTPEEVRRLLDEADKSRYGVLVRFLVQTGLRRGEALALRWSDVDHGGASVRVAGTLSRVRGALVVTEPKTARSRRTVPVSPAVVALLRDHKRRQAEDRLRAGSAWHDLDLVFATEAGGYVDPRNALRAFTKAATAAELGAGVGLHTLRHTAASTMLAAGVPLVTVSEILGHSSVAITGDIYGHATSDGLRDAMTRLADAFA